MTPNYINGINVSKLSGGEKIHFQFGTWVFWPPIKCAELLSLIIMMIMMMTPLFGSGKIKLTIAGL